MQPGILNQVACSANIDSRGPIRSFFAPGRINIIGEHLDYNGGYVFPGAISLGITGSIQYRDDMLVQLGSGQEQQAITVDLESRDELAYNPERGWANYPLGAIVYLLNAGHSIKRGMNIHFSSTLPQGSGLSSSAALEVLTAYMVLAVTAANDTDLAQLARLMQTMENEYIGVQCGIMDQFAVALGRKDHAILLNSDTLEYVYIPVNMDDHVFIIMNSNRPRRLADSRYNQRRSECEQALARIRAGSRPVAYLADATEDDIDLITDTTARKRARHVVSENRRVLASVAALKRGDIKAFGTLLNESHASLRDDYEVTGPELDNLVMSAVEAPGCVGARMTGAGFGGCAIALVEKSASEKFTRVTGDCYTRKTGLTADFFESGLEDGVHEIR